MGSLGPCPSVFNRAIGTAPAPDNTTAAAQPPVVIRSSFCEVSLPGTLPASSRPEHQEAFVWVPTEAALPPAPGLTSEPSLKCIDAGPGTSPWVLPAPVMRSGMCVPGGCGGGTGFDGGVAVMSAAHLGGGAPRQPFDTSCSARAHPLPSLSVAQCNWGEWQTEFLPVPVLCLRRSNAVPVTSGGITCLLAIVPRRYTPPRQLWSDNAN